MTSYKLTKVSNGTKVVLATGSNVPDAARKIDKLKPQLVFLDIEMSPYSGFDLLKMINEQDFEVFFATNYNKFAIQAFKALPDPLYLNKDKTGKCKMQNLLTNFRLSNEEQKIALSDKNGLHFFELRNIVRCQSDNSYTEFYILDERSKLGEAVRIVISKGINDFEDFLMGKGFFYRVHNQHLVNINHISKYVRDNGGYLVMDDNSGESIPVSRARKDEFLIFLRAKCIIL